MPKLRGLIKLEGSIGDLTFFKSKNGYIVKEKTVISAERRATDPKFERTRENASEFGRAGKAGKVLRNAIRLLLKNAKDDKMNNRLTQTMMKVVKADTTSIRGQRNVLDGETELLEGFNCNTNAKLETTLYAAYTTEINRVTGTLTVNIPSFVPARDIVTPEGCTHFKIVSCGSEIDFEAEAFITDTAASNMLPLTNEATIAISLSNTVTANSVHPLFLLLGIQFYQQVNGIDYPLKNGAFNALTIIKVSGV